MTHFVDGHHIWVTQRRGSTRLALEKTQAFGVFLKVWRQQLDGNLPPEFQIPGKIDVTHASMSDRLENLEVIERAADGGRTSNFAGSPPDNVAQRVRRGAGG